MSKLVVVLLPGGAPEYLTVEDNQTTVTWFGYPQSAGDAGRVLPIETYFCEGEEFHFARVEKLPDGDITAPLFYLTAQKTTSLIGLMSNIRQRIYSFCQSVDINSRKRIRAK
ncbi:hypothetical protein [Phytobacter sp. V91]|uniref:hypothetical protein n=1 Tax=Phytobacter sp. V91 TaxID=3369425 RepID=UPI003F604B62